jgi:hypothetical protein
LLEYYDPERRESLPPTLVEIAIQVLNEPWRLKALEIEQLELVFERTPGLDRVLAASGIDRAQFLVAIEKLEFGEKVSLVDRAIQAKAPQASAARPEEP